jgi:hypothetical protein
MIFSYSVTAIRMPDCIVDCLQGIPTRSSESLMLAVEAVHCLGVETCSMVNNHPVFGIFQGIPETRVELFFERPLNMCMALGVEHSLQGRNKKVARTLCMDWPDSLAFIDDTSLNG